MSSPYDAVMSITPRPEIVFVGKRLERVRPTVWHVEGDWTMKGVSKPVRFYANVRYLAQPELYDLIVDYDPLLYWRSISVDSLALFGADDTNVPSTESAERLTRLGNPRINVIIYDGSGHALESPRGQGNSIIREDALVEISGFIQGNEGR